METEEPIPACTKAASTIQAIDKKSVHRICSGQVVLTLATAVKELVENSIDAGATTVEVKLKEYGSESIEVSDNGCGVEEKNFQGLTLKHYTSKLQDFEDLINVSTFGFRGEALSSLCALSNMAITTRHESVSVGTRLEYDINGKVTQKKNTPRQIGTTVLVQNIFHTLPVRHKEFQRNLKKDFARLIQVLNAYCIINTGVRISCSNQTSKGSRSTVVSTNGNVTMKENITNIFGPKQLHSLLEIKQVEAKEEICTEFGIKHQSQGSLNFKIEGYVSKCEHGQGRSTSDRQFLFINKRPCDATKIFKVVNEVYHSYNRHQNPFIALHIQMSKESVDVNVTPDKRQIFVDGEKVLFAVLKASLIEMFEPTTNVYKLNNTFSTSSPFHFSPVTPTSNMDQKYTPSPSPSLTPTSYHSQNDNEVSLSSSLSKLKRSFSSAFDKNKDSLSSPVLLKNIKKPNSFPYSSPSMTLVDKHSKPDVNSNSMLKFVSCFSRKDSATSGSGKDGYSMAKVNTLTPTKDQSRSEIIVCDDDDAASPSIISTENSNQDTVINEHNTSSNLMKDEGINVTGGEDSHEINYHAECIDEKPSDVSDNFDSVKDTEAKDLTETKSELTSDINGETETTISQHEDTDGADQSVHLDQNITVGGRSQTESSGKAQQITDRDIIGDQKDVRRKEVTVKFSLENLKSRLQRKSDASSTFSRSFRAKICPGDNKSAEEELSREISKDMFSKMKILGQFNLGFIITQSGSDLFIVDQHATDEKYNFEMLQRNTVLQSQRLIIPQCLQLTASNETILMDNLEIFKKNGFDFKIEPDAPPTQRVKLISAPVSKNWNFGKDDIEELLFMLSDSPDVMCRPSRVKMMFASRACRKSIMIGTALNHSEMKRVVTHMGEIEQPWNCPHGRPTMRHLFNMNMLPS